MSIQHLFRRITLAFGILLAVSQTATAQGIANSVSEPEFVPYVEDLQLFEQPDFSSYGQGVRAPEGWWGSVEYLNWTVSAPHKVPLGNPNIPVQNVYGQQGRTAQTGTAPLVTITQTTFITTTVPVTTVLPTIPPTTTISFTILVTSFTTQVLQNGQTPSNPAVVGPDSAVLGPTAGGYTAAALISPIRQTNSMDTGIFQSDFTSGGRFEFGRINDNRGWMVSSFNLGTQTQTSDTTNVSINFANQPIGFVDIAGPNTTPTAGALTNTAFLGDGYDDDLDGDTVYGRNGRDRGTQAGQNFNPPLDGIPDRENPGTLQIPVDYDDATTLPTVFTSIHVENRTQVFGAEAMRLWRLDPSPRGGIWELYAGARYLDVDDTFNVEGTVDNSNPRYYLNPLGDTRFSTNAANHIFGGQIGSRWFRQTDRWQVSIETRFFAAANFQNVHQSGSFGSYNNTVVPGTNPANTVPFRDEVINMQIPNTFNSAINQTVFTPAGEIRFNLKYQVFRKVYLQLGYTALYADGIARASKMVSYTLPGLGIRADQNKDGLFMNGINIGVVINR
ncbi:MAG: BBP7 family outer membrane beta-barrel protein [Planctomycetia bacterium]|nr:BBP7 family outer membrane beta-barrel protein [Planctomycetia bacterium]